MFENIIFNLKLKMVKILSNFIKNKEERRKYKLDNFDRLVNEQIKKNRWGISYSVFDGEELLEASLNSVRDSVDYINVVYQTISWDGKFTNPDLLKHLKTLKDKGLIDELIEFKPNINYAPGKSELIKRNLGLKYAKKAKCNYFLTMDCDEFYRKNEFEETKKEIILNGYTHTFCPIIDYGTSPLYRQKDIANYAVQFFCKINFFSKLSRVKKHITTLVDPTRRMKYYIGAKYYFFYNIQMHHFSLLRKDLNKKCMCSSSEMCNKKDFDINKMTTAVNVHQVEDEFNILQYCKEFK